MALKLLGRNSFYGWVALSVAGICYFLQAGVLLYGFGVFMPHILKEFGCTRAVAGGAFSMGSWVAGLLSFPLGMFIHRFGARTSLTVGALVGAVSMAVLASMRSPAGLYVGYGVGTAIGFGFGGLMAAMAVANDWFARKKPLAMGIVGAMGGLGGMIMIPALGVIILRVGWRNAYWVSAIICVVVAVVALLLVRNRPEDLGQTPDGRSGQVAGQPDARGGEARVIDWTLGEAAHTSALWLLVLFFITVQFTVSFILPHQVAFLRDKGFSMSVAAMAAGLVPGIGVVGRLVFGFLGLKFKVKLLTLAGQIILMLGVILALFADSLPIVIAYNSMMGFGFGMAYYGYFALLPSYFGRANYAKFMGISMMFAMTLGSLAAPISGRIFDVSKSYNGALVLGACVLALGTLALIFAVPKGGERKAV
jgi:MFS family permease